MLIFTFPIGIYILFGIGADLKQDAWIGVLTSMVISIPLVYLFGILLSLYPGENIYGIIEKVFGRIIGKIIISIVVFHCIFVSSSILHNLTDFVELTALWQTPNIIPALMVIILCIWMLRCGIEVLYNWTRFNLIVIFLVVLLLLTIVISNMDINNIRPVLSSGIPEILKSSISISMLGFAEIFVFMGFCDCVESKGLKTIFIKPVFLACIVCTAIVIVNILLLGGEAYGEFYYPGYESTRRIYVLGEYQRLEATVSISFMIFRFVEICFYLFAASKGIQSLFKLNHYKVILAPIGFIVLNISHTLYNSMFNAIEFIETQWPIYGIITQVVLPIFILLVALLKRKLSKHTHGKSIQ